MNMKIKMLKRITQTGRSFSPGQTIEIDERHAKVWIAKKRAELAPEDAVAELIATKSNVRTQKTAGQQAPASPSPAAK